MTRGRTPDGPAPLQPRLSFLDLVPILEDGGPATALRNAGDVVRCCEDLGYHRYWAAEHHGLHSVGAAATAVLLAHAGTVTSRIRIGAGGVMLPNHAPLVVAEQFGTLDGLFPGRIDLGLGRAAGAEPHAAMALRRSRADDAESFPRDVQELIACFAGDPRLGYTAVPGAGANVAIWMLGSSTYGAQLAALLGLPFAFASHIAPAAAEQALAAYRAGFRPSAALERPYVMMSYNVFAADTVETARFHASSMQSGFIAMYGGAVRSRGFPPPVEGYYETRTAAERQIIDFMMTYGTVGVRDDLARDFRAVLDRTRADEIIVTSPIYDHAARLHSIAITAEAMAQVTEKEPS